MNDDFREAFHRAGAEAPPHQLDLAATVRRGTTLRRRRAVVRGVATMATLAVLGGIGVLGVQTLAPRAPAALQVAGGPTPTPTASTPTPTPTTSEAPRMGAAEREALRTFVRTAVVDLLAPYGTVTPDRDQIGYDYFTGSATLTDDHGTTTVGVFVSRASNPDDADDRREVHPTSCAEWETGSCRTLADGSFVVTGTATGYAKGDPRNTGEYSNFAALYRPDRAVIRLTSSNGTGEKGKPLRDDPPLTEEQLAALVTDPVWDDVPLPD